MNASLQNSPTAAAYTDLGVWYAKEKQYGCAADAFATSLQMEPDQKDAGNVAFMFGTSLLLSGDAKGAISGFSEAERRNLRSVKLHLMFAAAYDQLQWTGSAESEWRAALALDWDSSDALDGLSSDLNADSDYAATITLLENPIISGQRTAEQSLNLGLAYNKIAKPEEAAKVLRDGLNTSPDSLPLANALANMLAQLGRSPEAITVLDLALAQNPGDPDTGFHYLMMLGAIDPGKAREAGRKLLLAAPAGWKLLYLNGVLEMQDGKLQAAREHLEKSVALNPDFAQSHDALGVALAQLNDMRGAKEQLEKAIALGDNDAEVKDNLSRVLRILGEAQ
jgi:tetratricopeptide (TPR) repeat protein